MIQYIIPGGNNNHNQRGRPQPKLVAKKYQQKTVVLILVKINNVQPSFFRFFLGNPLKKTSPKHIADGKIHLHFLHCYQL